jgi:hypothetical protein
MEPRTFAGRPRGYSVDDAPAITRRKQTAVLPIVLAMLVIMILAGVIVLYVAFPHRGEEMPRTPWVGDALRKGVDRLPTLDNQRSWEKEHSDL